MASRFRNCIGVALILLILAMCASCDDRGSALGKTPEAARGLAVFVTLVLVMLGGAWVPAFVFPQWLQAVTKFVPTRWAMDGLDAMTWRGLGMDAAVGPIAVLLGFALVFGAVAVHQFRWDAEG